MASLRWQARNAAARAKGYKSYYDYRAHDYGRIAPEAPRLSGAALTRARGHAGYADFMRELRAGRVEIVAQIPGPRNAQGEYTEITLDVQLSSGASRSYRLHGRDLKGERITALRDALQDAGADVYVNPSLDILSEIDTHGGNYDYGEDEAA